MPPRLVHCKQRDDLEHTRGGFIIPISASTTVREFKHAILHRLQMTNRHSTFEIHDVGIEHAALFFALSDNDIMAEATMQDWVILCYFTCETLHEELSDSPLKRARHDPPPRHSHHSPSQPVGTASGSAEATEEEVRFSLLEYSYGHHQQPAPPPPAAATTPPVAPAGEGQCSRLTAIPDPVQCSSPPSPPLPLAPLTESPTTLQKRALSPSNYPSNNPQPASTAATTTTSNSSSNSNSTYPTTTTTPLPAAGRVKAPTTTSNSTDNSTTRTHTNSATFGQEAVSKCVTLPRPHQPLPQQAGVDVSPSVPPAAPPVAQQQQGQQQQHQQPPAGQQAAAAGAHHQQVQPQPHKQSQQPHKQKSAGIVVKPSSLSSSTQAAVTRQQKQYEAQQQVQQMHHQPQVIEQEGRLQQGVRLQQQEQQQQQGQPNHTNNTNGTSTTGGGADSGGRQQHKPPSMRRRAPRNWDTDNWKFFTENKITQSSWTATVQKEFNKCLQESLTQTITSQELNMIGQLICSTIQEDHILQQLLIRYICTLHSRTTPTVARHPIHEVVKTVHRMQRATGLLTASIQLIVKDVLAAKQLIKTVLNKSSVPLLQFWYTHLLLLLPHLNEDVVGGALPAMVYQIVIPLFNTERYATVVFFFEVLVELEMVDVIWRHGNLISATYQTLLTEICFDTPNVDPLLQQHCMALFDKAKWMSNTGLTTDMMHARVTQQFKSSQDEEELTEAFNALLLIGAHRGASWYFHLLFGEFQVIKGELTAILQSIKEATAPFPASEKSELSCTLLAWWRAVCLGLQRLRLNEVKTEYVTFAIRQMKGILKSTQQYNVPTTLLQHVFEATDVLGRSANTKAIDGPELSVVAELCKTTRKKIMPADSV